jgi:hypothetical protein
MGDCTCAPTPVSRDTEGGRIGRVLEKSQALMRAQNLAKAQAYRGGPGSCGNICYSAAERMTPQVPVPSAVLAATVKQCYSKYSKEGCVPSSVQTARTQLRILEQSVDPFNRDTRFSEYRGPFIPPVCPPIPQEALNANIPRQNMRSCPLPNKPNNPVLPT